NYGLDKPIGDDETGFKGTGDRIYRGEAWDFLVAGGAGFSNLDYSFSCKHPGGTAKGTTSPGGGGPAPRGQVAILKGFFDGFDFVRMRPEPAVLRGRKVVPAPGEKGEPTVRVLAEKGRQYAVYVRDGVKAELTLDLPAGNYRAEWVNPRTGKVD